MAQGFNKSLSKRGVRKGAPTRKNKPQKKKKKQRVGNTSGFVASVEREIAASAVRNREQLKVKSLRAIGRKEAREMAKKLESKRAAKAASKKSAPQPKPIAQKP